MSDPALERTPMTNDAERVSDIVAALHRSITTASNDDLSEPTSDKRSRHVARITAMSEALDIIEAQSKALAEAREALKPFADFAEKAEQFVADRAKDGASPVMPSTDFRLADFRRARAALATPTPENPNG